jgi:hypothetical protein
LWISPLGIGKGRGFLVILATDYKNEIQAKYQSEEVIM